MLAFNYFTHSANQYNFYNSDALTIFTFLKDVLTDHGRIAAWHFSNAPNFVPDYLIGGIAYLLSKDIYTEIFFSALIQVGLFYIVIRRLSRPLLQDHCTRYALCILLVILYFSNKDVSPYFQIFILNWHFGTYLVGLFYLSIYVHLLPNRGLLRIRPTFADILGPSLLLCFIAVATTLSDMLFVLVFVAPLSVMGFFYFVIRKLSVSSFAALFIAPFMCSWGAKMLTPLVVPNFSSLPMHFISYRDVWPKFSELFVLLYDVGIANFFIVIFFIWCMISLGFFVKYLAKKQWEFFVADRTFLAMFCCASLFLSLLGVIGTNAQVGERYLPALFFSPFVFYFLLAPEFFRLEKILIGVIGLLLALHLGSVWQHRSQDISADYYPDEIGCLDNALSGIDNSSGVGEYWLTKQVPAFSKNKVKMVSVNPDLSPYNVLISDDWYKRKFNFAVIKTNEPKNSPYLLDEKIIENYNGKSDITAVCGNLKIVIYKQGLDTAMNLARGNGEIFYRGCNLPNSTGTKNQADICSLKSVDAQYEGNLSYGPYVKLTPGDYEYDLKYISKNTIDKVIGRIEIAFLFPEKYEIRSQAKWTGSAGAEGHLKGKLNIEEAYKNGLMEPRTFIGKDTDVEVLGIFIKKIH